MRRFLHWLFRKTLDPPMEQRQEPDELERLRKEWPLTQKRADRAVAEVRRLERTTRKR